MESKGHILWVDDEIEMLKPHILYLENKGYEVTPVKTGEDAIHFCDEQNIDLVLLDEMMTGKMEEVFRDVAHISWAGIRFKAEQIGRVILEDRMDI